MPIDTRLTRIVPCGTCTECCKNDAIFIHPECGDVPGNYETDVYEGRLILKHKQNGDCIYLDDSGCTIHARRPTVCRELDCRLLLEKIGTKRLVQLGMGRVAYAARRLIKNGKGTSAE